MPNRKKQFVLVAGLLAFTACCSIYAAQSGPAASKGGRYEPSSLGAIHQSVVRPLKDDSSYEAPAYPLFAPALAEGEGRPETESFCSLCHSTRYIVMQPPLPGDTWAAEVTKMIKVYGAPIPEASAQKIVTYLRSHYTPETRKQ
jgi:hypothetical protein